MRVIQCHHPPGAKCAHVQPHRGGARTTVEHKGDWSRCIRLIATEIRHIGHGRLDARGRRRTAVIASGRRIILVRVLGVDHLDPGLSLVGDLRAINGDRAVRDMAVVGQNESGFRDPANPRVSGNDRSHGQSHRPRASWRPSTTQCQHLVRPGVVSFSWALAIVDAVLGYQPATCATTYRQTAPATVANVCQQTRMRMVALGKRSLPPT